VFCPYCDYSYHLCVCFCLKLLCILFYVYCCYCYYYDLFVCYLFFVLNYYICVPFDEIAIIIGLFIIDVMCFPSALRLLILLICACLLFSFLLSVVSVGCFSCVLRLLLSLLSSSLIIFCILFVMFLFDWWFLLSVLLFGCLLSVVFNGYVFDSLCSFAFVFSLFADLLVCKFEI